MDIRELIPKNKHDHESVQKLNAIDRNDIKPILPDLMVWLQDSNWPISREIEDLIIGFQEELIPHIKNVFNTDDGCWKHVLLYGLVSKLPNHILLDLKSDLERMKYNPTDDENDEELDEILNELLDRT